MTQKPAALGPCAYTEWYFNPCGRKAFALGDRFGKQVPLCRIHHPGRELEATKRLHARASLVPVLVAALEECLAVTDRGQLEHARAVFKAALKAEKETRP